MQLPIDPNSRSLEYEPMDETVTYEVIITKLDFNGIDKDGMEHGKGPDKNGNGYLSLQTKVVMPEDWTGRVVFDSYIAMPGQIDDKMTKGEIRQVKDRGVRFWRMVEAFKLDVEPFVAIDCIGKMGKITISNQEFNGAISAKVDKYLI